MCRLKLVAAQSFYHKFTTTSKLLQAIKVNIIQAASRLTKHSEVISNLIVPRIILCSALVACGIPNLHIYSIYTIFVYSKYVTFYCIEK